MDKVRNISLREIVIQTPIDDQGKWLGDVKDAVHKKRDVVGGNKTSYTRKTWKKYARE